jgi:signal transduction histidine kinase
MNEVVRLHNGTIKAESHKDGGLLVTIILPIRIPLPEDRQINMLGKGERLDD